MITVSKRQGEKTLAEQEENAKDDLFAEAQQDDLVQKVFEAFPKAEVKNVKILEKVKLNKTSS